MKKKPRVLLTGDDGYNSIGIRVLIHMLKDTYDLAIAATENQQSGVGGHFSFKTGGKWREVVVDGIRGISVDEYPVDAIEVAQAYFREHFDLVISGINLGANASGSFITSGTVSAALRSLALHITPRAVAMSWHTPAEFWTKRHSETEDITQYLAHPGANAVAVLDLCRKYDFWGMPLLNINFPASESGMVAFTAFHPDITSVFTYPNILDAEKGTYAYPVTFADNISDDPAYDVGALLRGYVSITPCRPDLADSLKLSNLACQTMHL